MMTTDTLFSGFVVRLSKPFGPAVRFLLAGFGLWWSLPELGVAVRADEVPGGHHHDLRSGRLPAELTLFQVVEEKLLKFEPQGLRITFPKTYLHPYGGVGVAAATALKGDFDITATVEILDLEPPRGGPGAGVGLSIGAEGKQEHLRRVVGPRGKHSVFCTGYHQDQQKKGPLDWKQHASVPCDDNILRLRLKRTGATLQFLWAAGAAGGNFAAIHEREFGNDDIEHVRLVALNGRQAANLDVRLIDLRIVSGGAQAVEISQPVEKVEVATGRLAMGLVVGLALIVLLACVASLLLYLRRRKSLPVAATAVNDAEVVAGSLSAVCSGCGKTFRVNANLAGKKVKCTQCGTAVRVSGE